MFTTGLSSLWAGIYVCCAADKLSPLLGPHDRVKPQLGPVLPLPLVGLADQSCNPSPAFLITWTGSHVAVVAHSPVCSTQLDCHFSQQLQATLEKYRGGVRGLEAPWISSLRVPLIGGTYWNPLFVFWNATIIHQIWYLCLAGVGFTVSWGWLT